MMGRPHHLQSRDDVWGQRGLFLADMLFQALDVVKMFIDRKRG